MNDKIKELKQTERDLSAASKTLKDAIDKLEALTQKLESDGPEIPEGFRRHDGGDCPVPDGVKTNVYTTKGNFGELNINAGDRNWDYVRDYKVTDVPTLSIDDVKDGDKYWYITSCGNVTRFTFRCSEVDLAFIYAKNAYASRELAECALDWGCVSDCVKAMLDNKGSE